MNRKVIRVDDEGLYLEDIIIGDYESTPEGCIDVECPGGFYRPKWDGSAWIEGMTPEEIAAIPVQVDVDAALAAEIEAATTLAALKAALLGKNGLAKVKANRK